MKTTSNDRGLAPEIFERPPYRRDYGRTPDQATTPNAGQRKDVLDGRDEPYYVLPAFLMSPDLTPESERPRDPSNLVDHSGEPVDLDKAAPGDLAFEPNPYLVSDKWREHWRKVHGMRFTHKDSPDDQSMALMLRYDQVHRVAGGPTNYFPPPYGAPVDENGQLHSEMLTQIPAYNRPRWDGFAYMAFDTLDDLKTSFGQGKFPAKIVPEEQIMFRSVPHMIAKEYIIIPTPAARPAIVLVKVHVRPNEESREAAQKHWLGAHADLVLSLPATHQYVERYAQLHNVGPEKEGDLFWHTVGSQWDGISIMHFASMNDCEDYLSSPDYAAIEADERAINDPQHSEYFTCVNYNIINKLYPERATRR